MFYWERLQLFSWLECLLESEEESFFWASNARFGENESRFITKGDWLLSLRSLGLLAFWGWLKRFEFSEQQRRSFTDFRSVVSMGGLLMITIVN